MSEASGASRVFAWKDADGRLTVPVPCERCGYDLRTQRLDARCPECGTPVAASARPGDLRLADPQRLDRVINWLGVTVWALGLLAALPACFLLALAASIVVFLGAVAVLTGPIAAAARPFWMAVLVVSVPASLAGLIGLALVLASLCRLAVSTGDPIFSRYASAARRRLLLAAPASLLAVPAAIRTEPPLSLGAVLIGLGAATSCIVPLAYALADLWDALHDSARSKKARLHRGTLSIGGALLVLSGAYALLTGWLRFHGLLAEALAVVLGLVTFFAIVGLCPAVIRLAAGAGRMRALCREIRALRDGPGSADG